MAFLVLGIVVLVGGIAVATGNDSTQNGRCLNGAAAERFVRPGVSVDVSDSWWPPGTRCAYHYPDGSSAELTRNVAPGVVTAIVLTSVATAGLPVALVLAMRRRGAGP